ncbi:MAG: stage III sporulation protein AE [Bacillota bacterium]|nr:stage III sporulation protein AE [Bacillota bacterium]
MKKLMLIFSIMLIFFIPFNVQASNTNNYNPNDSEEIQRLYDYMTNMKTKYEILKDVDVKTYVSDYLKTGGGGISSKKVTEALLSYSIREVLAAMKFMTVLIIISVICALLTNLQKAFNDEGLSNIAYFACYSLIVIIISKCFYIGVQEARDAMNSMVDFMTALIPVLLMLTASAGGVVQSTVMDPLIIGIINISARIFIDILIPLILMSFVLQFVNNISTEYKVDQLTKLLNQIVMWVQGIVMTVFIGIITIRGISTKNIDEVTAKTAKFAVDSFVPVVGKSLSDAISTVAGYSILLKGAISSIGLIILVFIVILPIIKIFAMALIQKLTAALVQPISDKRIVSCISAAGDSLVLIASCLISVSVMFFIMVSIMASSGRAL